MFFIDYEQAVGRVSWNKFFMMLEQIHIENPILILTYNMYTKEEAIVSVKEGITGPTPIRRGSRQECLLSPLVYCIF